MSSSSAALLQKQLKELTKHPVPGFVVGLVDDDIYKWDVAIIGAPNTVYEGGYFKATMNFPYNFPYEPPTFSFDDEFYHPNVYGDGKLCISILHPSGDDPVSGERADERWNPTQSVESILISIISLLADPNCSSPANVEAGVTYRSNPEKYREIVRDQVEKSKKNIPDGFVMPNDDSYYNQSPKLPEEEEDLCFDSDYDDGMSDGFSEDEEDEQ